MFKSYLTVAMRNLVRQKAYSAINIFGLAVGLACCFLIVLFVQDELSYDRFNTKADRIYRVLWSARVGDNAWTIPVGPVPVADALAGFPEVEQTVRFRRGSQTVRQGDAYVIEKNVLFVEPAFFDVFTAPFVKGNPKTALQAPDAVVLTEETARRYFPGKNPLDQTLELSNGQHLRVTGVVKGFPPQAHFHFDFLAPLKTQPIVERRKADWGSGTVYAYIVLKPGVDAAAVEARLENYVKSHGIDKGYARPGDYTRFLLKPLRNIHLRSHLEYELEPNGDSIHIYIFSIIAVFILLLAGINFVNLATARAANRAREVGVRKVLGSRRAQLVRQFLFESFVYVAFALILALGLTEICLPELNGFTGKQLAMQSFITPAALTALVGIIMAIALLAGAYPAFFLAAFRPVKVLKAHAATGGGRTWVRNSLVIAQFGISVGLLIGTFVVRAQLTYMQNKKLGFDKEHVLIVHGIGALRDRTPPFREQLANLPQVVSSSITENLPGHGFDSTMFQPEQPANYDQTSLSYMMIDEYGVSALGLRIVEGRNFAPDKFASDTSNFLINQTAAQTLGWKNPVGKHMKLAGREGQIIGVVEDFHYESLRSEIKPLVLPYLRWGRTYAVVRLRPGNVPEAIAAVKQVWDQFVPQRPFEYTFLDQDYQRLYGSEQRIARIFGIFSALAVFIACLGLFGLAAFTAERRTKEIGIRKVLGASASGIVLLLSKDFIKPVLLANLIAWPVAYYALDRWLQNFAYHTDLGAGVFLLGALLTLAVALSTVSYQALKAARMHPADTLRYE